MSESLTLSNLEECSPDTLISSQDLTRLLMEYCNNLVRTEIKIERQFTRDLMNDKLDIAIQGFKNGIKVLAETLDAHNSSQSQKIADLELKLDTVSSYIEQQIHSLRSDVFKSK